MLMMFSWMTYSALAATTSSSAPRPLLEQRSSDNLIINDLYLSHSLSLARVVYQ